MAETLAAQIRQYLAVIITTVVATAAVLTSQTIILIKQGQDEVQIASLAKTIEDFTNKGPRYTLQDHDVYAAKQQALDSTFDHRITVLEDRMLK